MSAVARRFRLSKWRVYTWCRGVQVRESTGSISRWTAIDPSVNQDPGRLIDQDATVTIRRREQIREDDEYQCRRPASCQRCTTVCPVRGFLGGDCSWEALRASESRFSQWCPRQLGGNWGGNGGFRHCGN
jgi:hypothetical protein